MEYLFVGILVILVLIIWTDNREMKLDLNLAMSREFSTQKTLEAVTKDYCRVQELLGDPRQIIQLSPAEIQSNSSRVRQAEGLIAQLPDTHKGRNSWIMNYGTGDETIRRRTKWEQSAGKEAQWPTQLI